MEGKIFFSEGNKYLVVKSINANEIIYVFLTNIVDQNDSFFATINGDVITKIEDPEIKQHLLEIIAAE